MKSILRSAFINGLSLYFLTLFLPGIKVTGGLSTFIFAGLVLSLMFNFLKPIIGIISLPINLLTMGAFSFLVNVFIFYLATQIIGNITITQFTYPGISIAGFVIPQITLNTFFAYSVAALFQSIFVSFFSWLRK